MLRGNLIGWSLGCVLALLVPHWVVAEQGASTPEMIVEGTSDQLLVLIDESRDYVKEDPERFYAAVEALLRPVVDFEGFARSVMAAHYKSASSDQRKRFAETFKWGLVRSYALVLTEFRDGEITLVPSSRPQRSPTRKSVKMEIRTPTGEIYPVVYSMALSKDQVWRMRNIIINGVNIGLTYRSQFASAVQNPKYDQSLDAVIDAWADLLSSSDSGEDGKEKGAKEEADAASALVEAS
jgi:phospholipid transport system substrate-binding protein